MNAVIMGYDINLYMNVVIMDYGNRGAAARATIPRQGVVTPRQGVVTPRHGARTGKLL